MPAALLTLLDILGWIAVLVGVVILVWEAIAARALSRVGLGVLVVGVVLLILAAVLPSPTYVDHYDTASVAPVTLQQ